MKSLIAKDLISIGNQFGIRFRILVPIVLVIALFLFPKEAILYVLVCLPMVVAITAPLIAARDDVKSRWDKYLPSLPVLPREIVLSRYIFCGLCTAVAIVVAAVFGVTSAFFIEAYALSQIAWFILGGGVLALIGMSISLPIKYFFEGEAIQTSMTGSFMLLVVAAIIIQSTSLLQFLMSFNYAILAIAAITALIIMVYISYRIALFGYRKRTGIKP